MNKCKIANQKERDKNTADWEKSVTEGKTELDCSATEEEEEEEGEEEEEEEEEDNNDEGEE